MVAPRPRRDSEFVVVAAPTPYVLRYLCLVVHLVDRSPWSRARRRRRRRRSTTAMRAAASRSTRLGAGVCVCVMWRNVRMECNAPTQVRDRRFGPPQRAARARRGREGRFRASSSSRRHLLVCSTRPRCLDAIARATALRLASKRRGRDRRLLLLRSDAGTISARCVRLVVSLGAARAVGAAPAVRGRRGACAMKTCVIVPCESVRALRETEDWAPAVRDRRGVGESASRFEQCAPLPSRATTRRQRTVATATSHSEPPDAPLTPLTRTKS